MAEFARIHIDQIDYSDRLLEIDNDYAQAIAASMEEVGQISPISVRRTPAKNKGKTPFTLVAGGHRTVGAKLLGWQEIDAIIVAAGTTDAAMMEIAENLIRRDLSQLDRAIFVLKYRELWEEKHGRIERGGDRKSNWHDATLIFAPGRELAREVQERLGFSPDKYNRASRIGQNLRPELRAALRGTPAENDQSKLLKLAKMEPEVQIKVAAALREGAELATVLAWAKPPKPAADGTFVQAGVLKKLVDLWEQATDETREHFLATIGERAGSDPLMKSIREAAE